MRQTIRTIIIISAAFYFLVAIAEACDTAGVNSKADDLRNLIPAWVKDSIYLSAENPYSAEKAKLGRYFFYDRRLSVNQSKSCASCHDPKFSFTDGYRRSIGALGDNVQHNAPALINIVFNRYLTRSDSSLHFPEQQINNPMFHHQPVELGWFGNETIIIERLKKDSFYNGQAQLLFKNDPSPFTVQHIQDCISSFVKTMLSLDAPYDRYMRRGDTASMSISAINGRRLFFSGKLQCSSCHGGVNFSTPIIKDKNGVLDYYQNTGLYNIDSLGAYPATDQGLYELTKQPADMGKYRISTLRNLAFTAPYLHDGSAASLEDVINIYAAGGRNIVSGDAHGDGRKNPLKSKLIKGFELSQQEKKDLINFLLSLSDANFSNSPLYANPFTADETHR